MFFILKKTKEKKKCHSPMIIAENLKEREKKVIIFLMSTLLLFDSIMLAQRLKNWRGQN